MCQRRLGVGCRQLPGAKCARVYLFGGWRECRCLRLHFSWAVCPHLVSSRLVRWPVRWVISLLVPSLSWPTGRARTRPRPVWLASAGMLCAHQQTIETTDAARHAGGGLVHFMHAESYGGARASAAATAHTAQAAGTPSMTSHAVLLTGLYE